MAKAEIRVTVDGRASTRPPTASAELPGNLTHQETELYLLCRVCSRLCALPLKHVAETMRPAPAGPIAGAPDFVRGVAVIRGFPVPVVDVAQAIFGENQQHPTRFVVVKTGGRRVALEFDDVVGVRAIPAAALRELPPLFQNASADAVAGIGTLDAELLIVLAGACLVPESVWVTLEAAGASL